MRDPGRPLYARDVGYDAAASEHERLPGWMAITPLVGSIVLAVPVAAQRGFSPAAIALVTTIALVALLDYRCLLPTAIATPAVLASVYLLLRSSDSSDIAPFYLVALTAASAASHPLRHSLTVAIVSAAILVVAWVWYDDTLSGIVIWVLGIALGHLGGSGIREQGRLAAELEAAHDDLAERAAADERQRIAREVHDVIAHSLTVTMLHLTAARLALDSGDAAEAADALREAEALGLQSLGDVRRVVGVLGADGATAEPQPDASHIPILVDDYRAAGLDVQLVVEGELDALSPATGLALYRIVQEGLANIGRHANGGTARVRIVVGPAEVDVSVANPVGAVTSPRREGGLGLTGMKARAEALGGRCSAGPSATGEWEVRASLPRSSS